MVFKMRYLLYISFLLNFQCKCIYVVNSLALLNNNYNASEMASVDYTKVPIVEKPLYTPPLEEIVEVLTRKLPLNFKHVRVSAEDSPDLTQPPYNLTAPGLTGDVKLVELGGPPYLLPLVRRDKLYSLSALLRHLQRDPALLAGAGAGPWPHLGVNCEGIINLYVKDGAVSQGTNVVSVSPVGAAKGSSSFVRQRLPASETRTALLGNYLLSDGLPGKVIKIVAENRIGDKNFITAIREALAEHYGDKVVGLGGTFCLLEGAARHHVMPDFSSAALCSDAAVEDWLHYFEHAAPLAHVGTLVTADAGLDLRLQHFHGVDAEGGPAGGHYHGDTTPARARYEGYFALAGAIVRVDAPEDTHAFGRD